MAEIGKSTRVVNRASAHIMAALNRAQGSLADIPLGVTKLDPRTEKKRAEATRLPGGVETTLTRLLFEMRGKNNDQFDPNAADQTNTGDQQQ